MQNRASTAIGTYLYPLFILILLLMVTGLYGQEILDMDQVYAEEEMQFGVRAFHEASYNKAVLSFEKSLSIKPEYRLAEEWLARTYYQNGYTSTALDTWGRLEEQGKLGAALQNNLSMLKYRRGAAGTGDGPPKYVEFFSLRGRDDDGTLFLRPTSVVPDRKGGFYVTAFAKNEVIQFSANGTIIRTIRGGIEGLNHPFDLSIHPVEGLYITEFSGDRIVQCSPDGRVIRRFGESGTGPGQLLGPQCISDDGKGYIYVTDQGNRRVVKFDYSGTYILSFGEETTVFRGLGQPTGILAYNDFIFVADKEKKQLVVFDESGNFVRTIQNRFLRGPEGISLYENGKLLVSDETHVLLFEIESESFTPLIIPDGPRARVVQAARDANDNLLLADFNQSSISMQADFSRMYSGLFVHINQVNADKFPRVYVDLTVQRRDGTPFVGLQMENFYISEGRYPADEEEFEYAVNDSDYAQVSLLIEGSDRMRGRSDMIGQIVSQLGDSLLPEGSVHVVHSGSEPVLRVENSRDSEQIRAAALTGALNESWKFDQGVRLAAAPLLQSGNRRAVIFINSGYLPDTAFESYQLIHLLDYMRNNNIVFYSVTLNPEGKTAPEIEYLCEKTGGTHIYAYNPEGISPVIQSLRMVKTGRYVLSFRSNKEPNFGRNYLPLEVQASIFGRSGRGEIGYFAPPE